MATRSQGQRRSDFAVYLEWLTRLSGGRPVAGDLAHAKGSAGFAPDPKVSTCAEDEQKVVFGRINHIGWVGEEWSLCGQVKDPDVWKQPRPDGPVCRACVQVMVGKWNQ